MRRVIYLVILLALTGAVWIADAQSERRERDRDRDRSRDRDRPGEQDRSRRERSRDDERREQPVAPPTQTVANTNTAPLETIQEDRGENVSTNGAPVDPLSYEAFRLIAQRNIFDPNRAAPGAPRTRAEPERPRRVDVFTLLGSISYDKGDFAFFDGSSSEYKKSVKAGDSIAGLKIAEVTSRQVTLEADGKKLELPVGSQMKRVEGEDWKVNSQVETFSNPTNSSTSSGDSPSSPASSGDGEMNPVLKRLLEQRKQGN